MYQIYQDPSFYLCEYNFSRPRWEWIKHFENEQELVSYIASCLRYTYIWDQYDRPIKTSHLENTLDASINITGNDTYADINGNQVFRNKMIVDANMRHIDHRIYTAKVLRYFEECQIPKKRYHIWRRHMPTYRYRYDPVPFTGHRYGSYGRKVKHWFRSYRDDRIPEYKDYVRKKAMVPNTWDSEPVEHVEKCWKSQHKCRHQWEKNLYHKKENYDFRFIRKKRKEEQDAIIFTDPCQA